jgi:hypothetical protein
MAKNNGGGPGTNTMNGVRSPMSSPFTRGRDMGEQVDMSGPFAGRSGGAQGLPTRVMDSSIRRGPTPGSPFTSPSSQGPNRPGTKQNKY